MDSFSTCPIPEIARLGRTLHRWHDALLACFITDRANKRDTEAVSGITELRRRVAKRVPQPRQTADSA